MKIKKWHILIPMTIIVFLIFFTFFRISYRVVDNLEDFNSLARTSEPNLLDSINQIISEQEGVAIEYISIDQDDIEQLHEAVISSINAIYNEGALQHRIIFYYYDDLNRCYFFSNGVLLHASVYGYYDYNEGYLHIIHGMF